MKLWHGPALAALSLLVLAAPATAEEAAAPTPPVADLAAPPALPTSDGRTPSAHEPATIDSPLAPVIRARLAEPSPAGLTEYETQERAALTAFYEARRGDPLWVTDMASTIEPMRRSPRSVAPTTGVSMPPTSSCRALAGTLAPPLSPTPR